MRRLLKEKRGEGFVDVCVLVLSVALVLALVVRIAPVFVAKQNLDVFADELVRTAEINGQVGSVTSSKAAALREETGNEQAENGFERQVRAGHAHDSGGGGLLHDLSLRGV